MRPIALMIFLGLLVSRAGADQSAFTTGPALADFGPVAPVTVTWEIPDGAAFRHSFDVSAQAAEGEANRTLTSAARFINMHVRAGVDADNIELAVVVHGKAVFDVSGEAGGSAALVAALIERGVQIIVCGQSAAHYGVSTDDLLPGVDMALSAMTAHALLQQEGYTLNPF